MFRQINFLGGHTLLFKNTTLSIFLPSAVKMTKRFFSFTSKNTLWACFCLFVLSLQAFCYPFTIVAFSKDDKPSKSEKPLLKPSTTLSKQEPTNSTLDWISGKGFATRENENLKPAKRQLSSRLPILPARQGEQLIDTVKPNKLNTVGGIAPSTNAYSKLATIEHSPIDLKNLGETIIALRRQVTDHPKETNLRLSLGTNLYLAGDYEGAANEIKRAIALSPGDARAHTQLAMIFDYIADQSNALTEFRRAEELNPSDPDIHLLFAEALMHSGNISDGINEYRRAIGICATARSLSGLAEALLQANDKAGSLKAARQAVSIDPGSSRAQVALTNALLQSGDAQSAIRTARQATFLDPSSADSHMCLGRCLYAIGRIEDASEEFKIAVNLEPLNAKAHNDLGYALYGRGDILTAVNEYRLALRLSPHFTEARNNLEVAIYRLSKKD